VQIMLVDEMGKILQQMKGKNENLNSIPALLMELFTSTNRTLRKEYAKTTQNFLVPYPHLTLISTAETNSFWSAFSSEDTQSGFLPRATIFEFVGSKEEINLKRHLEERAVLYKMENILQHFKYGGVPKIIPKTEDGQKYFNSWENIYREKETKALGTPAGHVYSRVPELASKLALIHALSVDIENTDAVSVESVGWACELTDYLTNIKIKGISRYIHDSWSHAESNLLLDRIKDHMIKSGKDTLTRSDIYRNAGRKFTPRQLDSLLETLVDIGELNTQIISTKGAPKKEYWIPNKTV